MRYAALLLALFAASPAIGDDALTFLGTLNGREIVVELTDGTSGPVVGRYAYRDTGGDVPLLAVSSEEGKWVLSEEAPCDDSTCRIDDNGDAVDPPVAATWTLQYDPSSYTATGTRTAAGGKSKADQLQLDVIAWRTMAPDEAMTPFGLHDRSASMGFNSGVPMDWARAPYEMLMLLDVPLEEGPEEQLGEARFRYVTDPRTKFAHPRIVSFADGSSVEAANRILVDNHGRMSLSAFDCLAFRYASYGKGENMDYMGGTLGDYDSESVTLTYASPRLMSWLESGSLWCTGAHPYNHIDSYTFDLETGERLDLSDIFTAWVPRKWGAGPDEVASVEDVSANPEGFYWGPSAGLIAFVRANVPDDLFDEELAGECLTDATLAERLDIRFVEEGAMFTLSGFPHALSVCGGDLFATRLETLKPFLAEGAKEYFPGI